MKHTPGPWELDGRILIGKTGTPIADIVSIRSEDARLIAAAPEILAALQTLVGRVSDALVNDGFAEDIHEKLQEARTALAKAKGEDSPSGSGKREDR